MFKFKEMILMLCLILSGALCYVHGEASTKNVKGDEVPIYANGPKEAERIGVDEIDNMHLYMEVYPNPASGVVNIEFSDELDEGVIEIYNSTGIKVDEIIVRNKTVSICTDHLPNGLYLINVVANGRSVNNAKIK